MQGDMVCMSTNRIVQNSAYVTRELGNSSHGFQHICDQTQILEIERNL
jgi:hypothetical protein